MFMAEKCIDKNCFAHGTLKTRGQVMEGTVVSDKPKRTVIIERDRVKRVPKYERYERRRSRISAHNPDCIRAKIGDLVRIAECRKISRTKAWTVTEIIQRGEA